MRWVNACSTAVRPAAWSPRCSSRPRWQRTQLAQAAFATYKGSLTSAKLKIAVFRNAEDEVFALAVKCSHEGGPLSPGIVYGCRVTYPLHGIVLEFADGTAVSPDTGTARSFPVRIAVGAVRIDPDAARAQAA